MNCRVPVSTSSPAGVEPLLAGPDDVGKQSDAEVRGVRMDRIGARDGVARSGGAASQRGQGTVEYVALILLVALVMAGVVAAMKNFRSDEGKELGDVILGKIKEAMRKVQF